MFLLYLLVVYLGAKLDAGIMFFVVATIWYVWWIFSDPIEIEVRDENEKEE